MRRFILSVVMLLVLAVPGYGQSGSSKEIESIIRAETDAYYRNDLEGTLQHFSRRPEVQVTLIGPLMYRTATGFDQVQAMAKEGITGEKTDQLPDGVSYEIQNLVVQELGDFAWVEWNEIYHHPAPGGAHAHPSHQQRLLVKEDGQWKVARMMTVQTENLEGVQQGNLTSIEGAVNNLGYALLNNNHSDKAIKLFTLNMEMFPNSANTYDSLGEAYMKAGDKQNAIKYYQLALDRDGTNENAANMIKQLKAGN